MKSVASQNGIDQAPKNHVTSADTAMAMARKGQPSRAMSGCGQGGVTRYATSVLRGIDQAVALDPRHHLAQARAHLLDRQLGGHAPAREQRRRARPVLEHELLGVLARLDAVQ